MDWTQYKSSSNFVTFKNVGDSIIGTITAIKVGADYNGNPCPVLEILTEEGGATLTAGQVMLKAALAEAAPNEGDKVRITYTGNGEAKAGRNPAKLFTVDVKRGKVEQVEGVSLDDPIPF